MTNYSKIKKIEIESSNGTQTDMTQYIKRVDLDNDIDYVIVEGNIEWSGYINVSLDCYLSIPVVVSKRRDDWICYRKDNDKIWECGSSPEEAVEKMKVRLWTL